MTTRATAYVAVNHPLPDGGTVTADFYALWPEGASPEAVEQALSAALTALRQQVRVSAHD